MTPESRTNRGPIKPINWFFLVAGFGEAKNKCRAGEFHKTDLNRPFMIKSYTHFS